MAQLAPSITDIWFHERAIASSNVLSTITKAKLSHVTAMLCFQFFLLPSLSLLVLGLEGSPFPRK